MRYLTFNELREKLGGRGRTTIYRDIAAKRLPKPIKLGGLNYFPEQAVDDALLGRADSSNTASRSLKGRG
ncbi:MAG: transcriptional regulator [Albidovulum sp.]|uniref:helix-turn-helix transcriptional regulator n=1 Tax=Albidovulum sp. TaxID=1872424 RepID=UPI003CA3A39D